MATRYVDIYTAATYTIGIYFNANGGGSVPDSVYYSNTSDAGSVSVYGSVPSTVPTRDGYTFLGYAWSSSGAVAVNPGNTLSMSFSRNAVYTGSSTYTDIEGNTVIERHYTSQNQSGAYTLYAKWELKTYTISYNANGGTGAPSSQTKTHGADLTLSSTVPTRENYVFQGWATSSTGTVAYQPGGTFSVDADTVLYAIWMVAGSTLATVTSPLEVGATGTATWNIVDASYTYKLSVTYSNAPAVTVNVAANTSSTTFVIPSTWYAYIPNSTSVTATASLTTYDGSTELVTTTLTLTVTIPASVKPTISAFTVTPYSSNATVNGWNTFTQGFSQANLSATATAGTGASLVSYAFSGDGVSQSGLTTTAQSSILTTTGQKTYSLIVTDSRGRTATSSVSITVYEYSTPSISSLASYRSLSNGTQSDTDGTYIHSTPVFTFASVNGKNSLSVAKIEYKAHSSTTWTSGVASIASNTGYTYGGGNVNIANTYDVLCTITDALGNSATLQILVPPVVGFAVGLNNDRARFGGPCEEAGLVCDWNFKLKGDFVMDDGAGNTATMTYADFVSILSGGGGVTIQQDANGGLSIS